MGKILNAIRDLHHPTGKIIGPKENCLITKNNTVIKETRYSPGMAQMGYHGHGNELHKFTFYNELNWLTKLSDSDIVPSVISYDENLLTIEMTYVGEQISKTNIPINWEMQCDNIITILHEHKCSHNDIKPDDILVHDKKLYLVDFGWATELGSSIPSNWPKSIGGEFKYNINKFDDRYSLTTSINYILNNE